MDRREAVRGLVLRCRSRSAPRCCSRRVRVGVPADHWPCTEVRYEGGLDLEGHYERPGVTRPYHSRQRFLADPSGTRFDSSGRRGADGDSAGAPEIFFVAGDRVFHRDNPNSAWSELTGERAALGRLQALSGLPRLLQRAAATQGLTVVAKGDRVAAIERRRAHPRLGDVRDSIAYAYGAEDAPESFDMTLYERDHQWRLQARRTSFSNDVALDSLSMVPAVFDTAAAETEPVAEPRSCSSRQAFGRSIRRRRLALAGGRVRGSSGGHRGAVGSANGEACRHDAAQWPQKPIRYALFSHHHPHYTGGLRALIAAVRRS
jgi:hypothetical protein